MGGLEHSHDPWAVIPTVRQKQLIDAISERWDWGAAGWLGR